MAKQLVRIKCRPHDKGQNLGYDITIEAVIEDGFLCAMHWFGQAALDGHYYFFRLEHTGRIDFGSGFRKDRFWTTTLNRRAIRAGETFSISGIYVERPDREVLYTIVGVEPVFRDV